MTCLFNPGVLLKAAYYPVLSNPLMNWNEVLYFIYPAFFKNTRVYNYMYLVYLA